MARSSAKRVQTSASALRAGPFDANAVLNALADPIFVVDPEDRFGAVNSAAEQFFGTSAHALVGRRVDEIVAGDSPLHHLVLQARDGANSVSQYGVTIDSPRFTQPRYVSIDVSPIPEMPGCVAVALQERSIARKIDHQLTHRNAARSVTAMAALLAHEVKNPLSGIRGAAQLLEQSAADADRALTGLICEEADRIVALVDRMEMFSDERPIQRGPVNIHEVLEHVRKVAQTGFASKVRIRESYDPSPVEWSRTTPQ